MRQKLTQMTTPTYSLNITTNDLKFIEVKAFQDSTSFIIHSSQNPEAWFDDASLIENNFCGKVNLPLKLKLLIKLFVLFLY